jgi:hypothetical protein
VRGVNGESYEVDLLPSHATNRGTQAHQNGFDIVDDVLHGEAYDGKPRATQVLIPACIRGSAL